MSTTSNEGAKGNWVYRSFNASGTIVTEKVLEGLSQSEASQQGELLADKEHGKIHEWIILPKD